MDGPSPGQHDGRHRDGSQPDRIAPRTWRPRHGRCARPPHRLAGDGSSRRGEPHADRALSRRRRSHGCRARVRRAARTRGERGQRVGDVLRAARRGVRRPIGGAVHARAGALRHHALGRTVPDRLSRDHARGRVARARRAWRARRDRRGDRGRGPRGRRGARVPGGAGRSRASDRRPGHGVHVLHGRARVAGRRRAGRGSRRGCVTWSGWAGTPTRTPRWRARSSARSTAGAGSPRRGSSAWSTASALETDALALADLAGRRTQPGPGE